MLEYVVIAYDPDHRQFGDHVARTLDDAFDYARESLEKEGRDGAYVMISIVQPNIQLHRTPIKFPQS